MAMLLGRTSILRDPQLEAKREPEGRNKLSPGRKPWVKVKRIPESLQGRHSSWTATAVHVPYNGTVAQGKIMP